MRCQAPMSYLYQPAPGWPALAPKYAKCPAAPPLVAVDPVPPLVRYSWFPTTGRVMDFKAPSSGRTRR